MIVHRTADGIVVTGKTVRFTILVATLIGGILGGVIRYSCRRCGHVRDVTIPERVG